MCLLNGTLEPFRSQPYVVKVQEIFWPPWPVLSASQGNLVGRAMVRAPEFNAEEAEDQVRHGNLCESRMPVG